MIGLPYGEEIMIVGRTMWTQSTSVTDGRTDRQTDRRTDRIMITKTVLRIASHGKNQFGDLDLVHLTLPPSTPAGYGPGPRHLWGSFQCSQLQPGFKGLTSKRRPGRQRYRGRGRGREGGGGEGRGEEGSPIFLTNVTLIGIIIMLGDEYSPPFNSLYYETLMAVTV